MPYPHPAQRPLPDTLSYEDRSKAEKAVRLYKRSHLYLPRSSYYLCIFAALAIICIVLMIACAEKSPESLFFLGMGLTLGLCPGGVFWWQYWRYMSRSLLREAGVALPEDAETCAMGECGGYGQLQPGKHVCVKKVAEV